MTNNHFPNHYQYVCTDCGSSYSPERIEAKPEYLCPSCGKAEKNRPLHGVLKIVYDYKAIAQQLTLKDFLHLPSGQFHLYPRLWPLALSSSGNAFSGLSSELLQKVPLNANPLLHFKYEQKDLLIMDETRNPTLSFKDRASILVAFKALQNGIEEIAAASTGNAGSSLAGICSRLGLTSRIFVPQNIPDAKRIQISAFGAKLHIVRGDYDAAFDLSLELSLKNNWYNRNTAYNPLTIEGKKSAAYDILLATGGALPDFITVPVGDGVIISGIYKGFTEMLQLGWINKMPALIGVQAEGSRALHDYLQSGKFIFKPAVTIADSISAGAPRNLYMAADSIKRSGGESVVVSDKEITEAQQKTARLFGILAEPAAAAAFAGFLKISSIPRYAKQQGLVLITGNGLKDLDSLAAWNPRPRKENNE